ncbi:MAG: PSD1 and planctomycete cytochrome C domain-containing protein [Verrucomicrobiales bacterium]|nr:PSD1 and planctomycete cytochrome C domain-containing protein [Verrucomicrobiales bacterium]
MRSCSWSNWLVRASFTLAISPTLTLKASQADAAGFEFFENKIRPVFVENCYKCHSADSEKIKGGFRLDTRDFLLKGGDTGPAIVPGDPEKSLLIKAVRYTDENLQMPPKNKKLSAEQISHLEAWVKMGAPDPRGGEVQSSKFKAQSSKHWAFQPVQRPALPVVKDKRWVQTPIDLFILAKLEEKGLTPSLRAYKRTLLRRVTFDLTGLPPTEQEVNAFLGDRSADAFAKVVDRLLASPHYGERWARHWLDVARYSDTKGYVFEEERRYPYAYTYRDYVIRAFNEDLPFDRFIIEQIAADQLPLGEDKRPLAAMGFLTLGRRFLNNQADIIDDRIDVVSRGLMALTVGCARCHDHKYDPIPTKDYYSLYGVFASCSEPGEKPTLGDDSLPPAYPDYVAERKKRQSEMDEFRATKEGEAMAKLRAQVGDYLLVVHDEKKLSDSGKQENLARQRKLDPRVVRRWRNVLDNLTKETNSIFGPWFAFAAVSETNFAAAAKELAESIHANDREQVHPRISALFHPASPPNALTNVTELYNRAFAEVNKQWLAAKTNNPALTALPDPNDESLRQVLYASGSAFDLSRDEMVRLFDTPAQQKVRALQRKVDELDATHPGSPPRAMALQDNPRPTNPHVFIRGNPNNRGPEVPRQFLEVLAGEHRKPFSKGSGRLELAEAIANRDNPLTARVIVNRVWLQYFGAGLVRTPSDFGLRSESPRHPELLDFLAAHFIDDEWSLKKLQRLIVLSSVYQQRTDSNPLGATLDSANQLLWRMNRRRLDFEAMRDSLLAVSGSIDRKIGGHPVDLAVQPFPTRRTVYGFVERQNLPGLFRTFDFANPDATSPQRFTTTVPQQALFMINSPFVVQQARQLVQRPEVASAPQPDDRVRALYQAVYQREPAPDELALARQFLKVQSEFPRFEPEMPAWYYGYGELMGAPKPTVDFNFLPAFTNKVWQGSGNLPDERLGWVMLNNTGGHAGNDQRHAAIRRWIAPRGLVISISGTLGHDSDKGDGVRGRIISSGAGELGSWIVKKSKQDTKILRLEVKKGETVDFVTDCRENVDSDSFTWAPVIKVVSSPSPALEGATTEWNARLDFGDRKEIPKPLSVWEKYAQVLLMSNELAFLD